jgi:hypothetical protein
MVRRFGCLPVAVCDLPGFSLRARNDGVSARVVHQNATKPTVRASAGPPIRAARPSRGLHNGPEGAGRASP